MQAKAKKDLEQVLKLVKTLPVAELKIVKSEVDKEIEKETRTENDNSALIELLLKGPTFSKKQLAEIARTRKEINQWRSKKL